MQNRSERSHCSQDHPEILERRQESGLNVDDSAGFLLDGRTNEKADLFSPSRNEKKSARYLFR